MASRDSGTVRPTKRKHVFLAAAVLLLVCVLAAGAVSADTVTVSNYEQLSKNISNVQNDRTIIVAGNVSITGELIINSGNITLTADGADYTLSRDGFTGNLFTVNSGGNLTITGSGTSNLTLDGTGQASNSLVYVNGGSFTLADGGILTNNMAKDNGGGVYVKSGTFTMTGGSITNNTAEFGFGGALCVDGDNNEVTITLSGGEISNNTATNGGGVFMKGSQTTITLSGTAKISNNKAVTENEVTLSTGHGGGVHIDDGMFSITDSATITGNKADKNGGGVYVHFGGTFRMSGGEISKNTASSYGGGVHVGAAATQKPQGTFTMSGGTITGNTATANGTGVYVGGVFNIQKSGTVNGVYLPNGKNITVTGTLNDNTAVTGIIPETPNEEPLVVDLANAPYDYLSMFDLDDSVENFALTDVLNEQKQGLVVTPIYTVTFNANGGTSVPSQMKVVSGNTVEKPKTTREGYTLEGWYYNTMHDTMKWDFTLNTVKTNITLTANWTPNTYTVTFEANGGSEVQPQTVNHGETVNKPDDPAKDDHTFAGWHKDEFFETPWDFNDGITSDMTLYAKWTPNKPDPEPPSGGGSSDGNMDNAYRVLFNDGATTLYIVTDLSAGDKLTKPEDPVKDGYTFAGWHKDTACTQAWDFNDGITGSMTLYAKWTPQETVTPTATATVTPTATATATITATPTGDASPAPTSQPDNEGSNGDTTNGETTKTSGISLPYLIGGILILLLAILLLLFLLLRHTVTFLIPTGGELEEYRIKVWHGRYINTEDLPDLIRTAAWYRDTERQERWDFNEDRVKKSIELYLG